MHLVLGPNGAFGGAMVRALVARGQSVRVLARDPARVRVPDGVEVIAGDALQLTDVVGAAKDCDSIVHGVNLPYAEWDPGMITLTDRVIEAAGLTGAAIVFPGNIYGLKPIYEVPLPPNSPTLDTNDRPNRKGALRNLLEESLALHAEEKNVRTLVVRAGDFYGPGADNGLVGPMFRNALAGKPIQWFGALGNGHAFTYVDDVATVATGILLQRDRPIHDVVAVAGHHFPNAAAWAAALAKAAGQASLPTQLVAGWKVRLLGLVDRQAREFAELLYQWDGAMLLDDARVRRALPDWTPTPAEASLEATMAWFRANPATTR
ncbi:MAG: NAD-dependent epimerase/dehydratase family protein [Pseudomonadota bacterium]|nr:NAD-dependent epimerase/dehydratase family protein [Pseudomonadota bacterium]